MDHTVRIPPEMMPSEEQALHYFDYFFNNIHPYCPVVNKAYFYQQWQTARGSISPLMLEAIFACATIMLEPASEGNKWLALASSQSISIQEVCPCFWLTAHRTRGELQGRISIEHNASNDFATESPRGVPKTWLLLAFLDDGREPGRNGKRP
jgi:hypothetical protein